MEKHHNSILGLLELTISSVIFYNLFLDEQSFLIQDHFVVRKYSVVVTAQKWIYANIAILSFSSIYEAAISRYDLTIYVYSYINKFLSCA